MKPQLFLLHFAGGNQYSFQFLIPLLESQFECIPLELPGRGQRMKEPFVNSMDAASDDYFKQIRAKRNKQPFFIYGHSMGALLGFQVAVKLESIGEPIASLVVSGNAGPGVGRRKERSNMSDTDFKAELKIMGGIQDELLNNRELFEFFSPILRQDFKIVESDNGSNKSRVICDIHAMMGDDEPDVQQISNWDMLTKGNFTSATYTGNHFFIHNHANEVSSQIINLLDRDIA